MRRRAFLKRLGLLSAAGLGGATLGGTAIGGTTRAPDPSHGGLGTVGAVDHRANGFDPMVILTDSTAVPCRGTGRDGRCGSTRSWLSQSRSRWRPASSSRRGPTTAGSRARRSGRPRATASGSPFASGAPIPTPCTSTASIRRRWTACPARGGPAGGDVRLRLRGRAFRHPPLPLSLPPLRAHIHRGLYGAFVVDPPGGRPPAHEMVMVLNAFDTDFDGENEVYAANTVAFAYVDRSIPIAAGELQRLHLVNVTEFDPLNSIHLHANFFHLYRTGTSLVPSELTDTISMGQAERHMLEFTYREPGRYMFHAHRTEFAELGWMSFFEVS